MSILDQFTESGKSVDEIVLKFSNGKKLFVSESLLRYASPVFEAMFEKKFKESKTRRIEMNDKSYDNFLELLLCLHPDKQKPVDDENVLRVVSLAHEYQMNLILSRCKAKMIDMLESLETLKDNERSSERCRAIGQCFKILIKANEMQLDVLSETAIQTIGSFGHQTIIGVPKAVFGHRTQSRSFSQVAKTGTEASNVATPDEEYESKDIVEDIDDPITECKALYDALPDELKVRVLHQRLTVCDSEK